MTIATRIRAAAARQPDATHAELARVVGCSRQHVAQTLARGTRRGRPPDERPVLRARVARDVLDTLRARRGAWDDVVERTLRAGLGPGAPFVGHDMDALLQSVRDELKARGLSYSPSELLRRIRGGADE